MGRRVDIAKHALLVGPSQRRWSSCSVEIEIEVHETYVFDHLLLGHGSIRIRDVVAPLPHQGRERSTAWHRHGRNAALRLQAE